MNRKDNMIDGWGVWQVAAMDAASRDGNDASDNEIDASDMYDASYIVEQYQQVPYRVMYDPCLRRFVQRDIESALEALPWAFDVSQMKAHTRAGNRHVNALLSQNTAITKVHHVTSNAALVFGKKVA